MVLLHFISFAEPVFPKLILTQHAMLLKSRLYSVAIDVVLSLDESCHIMTACGCCSCGHLRTQAAQLYIQLLSFLVPKPNLQQ